MPLNRQAIYGLQTICYLAEAGTDAKVSTHQIASDTGIPESFLANVVSVLSNAGLLSTTRGRHGGISLSRPSADITLLNVIQATQGQVVFFEPLEQKNAPQCIEQKLLDIERRITAQLSEIDIASLHNSEHKHM